MKRYRYYFKRADNKIVHMRESNFPMEQEELDEILNSGLVQIGFLEYKKLRKKFDLIRKIRDFLNIKESS